VTVRIRLIFAWYDLWVGCYWDRITRQLYVLPVPCFGFVIQFPVMRWITQPDARVRSGHFNCRCTWPLEEDES
jgi:hypothetical protein